MSKFKIKVLLTFECFDTPSDFYQYVTVQIYLAFCRRYCLTTVLYVTIFADNPTLLYKLFLFNVFLLNTTLQLVIFCIFATGKINF